MSESQKSAVLAKCEELTKETKYASDNDDDWDLEREDGGFILEAWGGCIKLNFCKLDDADHEVWQLAADILKITPTIDEFEADLSRRQYHHDLEQARKEGYEQGKAEAIVRPSDEPTLKEMLETANRFNRAFALPQMIDTPKKGDEMLDIPPESLAHEIWWAGVLAQKEHRVYGNEELAIKRYSAFMNKPYVVAAMRSRPSDALLLKCWDTAIQHSRRATTTGSISSDEGFFDWLATIPPDTLKADRELVKNIFRVSNTVKVSRGTKLWETIARLAGMEAPNE